MNNSACSLIVLLSFAVSESTAFSRSSSSPSSLPLSRRASPRVRFGVLRMSEAESSPSSTRGEGRKKVLPAIEPLPPPILSLTPGTWAHDTMSRRIDSEVLQRTFDENRDEFHSPQFAEALVNFRALRRELRNAAATAITHLPAREQTAEDYDAWHRILERHVDAKDTWLSTPWIIAEFYLYRRLLSAISYFTRDAPTFRFDPFAKQKRSGLRDSPHSAENVLTKIKQSARLGGDEGLAMVTSFALWGNKMDLSLWPATNSTRDVFSKVLDDASQNLLHDDIPLLTKHCQSLQQQQQQQRRHVRIDIIVDNAGFELVVDLALADYLIANKIASVVRFQCKAHPTFVSDAMEKDIMETIAHYANEPDDNFPACREAGKRWLQYIHDKRWECNEDYFWCQPLPMWDMPSHLFLEMRSNCSLTFVKGDANYRRLLGDLQWDPSEDSFQDIVGHTFPSPVCALRTLKAEIGCGMDVNEIRRAKRLADGENWMVTGRFGVVQFGTGTSLP